MFARKTKSKLQNKFYWPRMTEEIKKWIKCCKICVTRKGTGNSIKAPIKPMPVPTKPMTMISMDIVGPLPQTSPVPQTMSRNIYIY